VARPQKAQQDRRPVRPVRGEAQERKLRKVEREEEACVAKPREVQQGEYKRAPWKVLRERAEDYCGKEVPMDVR